MKTYIKYIAIINLIIVHYSPIHAQIAGKPEKLHMGKVEPYQLEVTYNKTTHLIFPAAIRYVDLGSELLIAGKSEDAENVLRVKASIRDFEEETNFSVITDDGRFYSFNVRYNASPAILNYDLLSMQKKQNQEGANDILFEELGGSTPSLAGILLETIYSKDKRIIKHIASKSYGISFQVKGIYIHQGKYYFHTELTNRSNVPFQIDFVSFKILDKKIGKRTVIQERALRPLRQYNPLEQITGNSAQRNVFLLDQFTLSDDKILVIHIAEKNGGRNQTLQVENKDLIHARLIKDLHVKIN